METHAKDSASKEKIPCAKKNLPLTILNWSHK